MKNRRQFKQPVLLCMLLCFICAGSFAQQPGEVSPVAAPVVMKQDASSDYVSITVDNGTLTQVLNTFALQSGRNVVIGPDVTSTNVTLHLKDVRWDDALEVILKPYGFGYRKVGDTIVISKLENLATLEAVEPLQTRVFDLKFVDAGDVKDMLQGQLSSRGSMSVLVSRGQKGWDFAGQTRNDRSASSLAKRERQEDKTAEMQAKSKTIVVTDIPGVLDKIADVLSIVDHKPQQILVEAKFVEVNDNYLKDIGVELGGSIEIDNSPLAAGEKFLDAVPNAFNPASGLEIAGKRPLNTFGQVTFNSGSVNMLINLLQEDDDSKVLSAPKVLTLNNQEATIIVGQKYPIIESNVSGGSINNNTSTTLDYYENIGIQLNVVPQISDEEYINMIVHPSVSSIVGYSSGIVSTGSSTNGLSLTQYPIINTREAETQILLRNTETIVIGGLLEERKGKTAFKVPFLGDIPIIGKLFRRDVDNTKNIDLLIFITATKVDIDQSDSAVAPPKEKPEETPVMDAEPAPAGVDDMASEDMSMPPMPYTLAMGDMK